MGYLLSYFVKPLLILHAGACELEEPEGYHLVSLVSVGGHNVQFIFSYLSKISGRVFQVGRVSLTVSSSFPLYS